MKKSVDTFIMYKPWRASFEALPDEEVGKLIKLIFQYQCEGTYEPPEDHSLHATFELLKQQMDWNTEKYRQKKAEAKRNGQMGGAPKGNKNAAKPIQQTSNPDEDICSKVVELFHSLCPSFKRVTRLTEQRKGHILTRYREGCSLGMFREVFVNMEKSAFLKGDNNRNREYGFDWAIKDPDHFTRIHEGVYAVKYKSTESELSDTKVKERVYSCYMLNGELQTELIPNSAAGVE